MTSIAFRQLDDSRYAFRERLFDGFFKLTYIPIMHGLLGFDHENGRVRGTGFANWFPIAFVVLFASTFNLLESDTGALAAALTGILGILMLIYAIQARRFWQVAATAAAQWDTHQVGLSTIEPSASRRLLGSVGTVSKFFMFAAVGVVLVPMALILIGRFTEEWTCREEGSDWKCVGGQECNAQATKRLDTFKRTVTCQRTDWPMVPIQRVLGFFESGRWRGQK